MSKIVGIFRAIVVLTFVFSSHSVKAEFHGDADGSCDPLCAAQVECRGYVEALYNSPESLFYSIVRSSKSVYVRNFCVYRVGLIV